MLRTALVPALLAGTLLAAGAAQAHDSAAHKHAPAEQSAAAAAAAADVPFWPGLGSRTFPISTSDPAAQRYFDQGLALAYGFNHWEAQRAFQAAQKLDPACAMCFWGEALVLGPNINWPMEAAAVRPAFLAAKKAARHAAPASDKEQALIAALAKRYDNDPAADRAALDVAYADAMQAVLARFPDDLDIATLTAEAMMDLSPWNYWGDGGKTPTGRTADIVAALEMVLAKDPDHMGAIHLYIHAVEASDRPQRAEPYADRLRAQNLAGAGHLVHMPSHIYFRVGRYLDSLELNKAAVAADEAYLAKVTPGGIYAGAYYPHNIHFVVVSAQMAGDAATALAAADKLDKTVTEEVALAIPMAQPVKAAPYFAHAQFSDPAAVLALPEPSDSLPYIKAMWRYARGVALARSGDLAAARAEADALGAIAATADFSALIAGGIPGQDIVTLARHVVLGRVAQAEAKLPAAIAEFEKAAALERTLPFMEPAYWYYPVGQSLGAALLMAGETQRAEKVLREALEAAPNNGWACFGLMEALKRRGEMAEASAMRERLARTWGGDPALLGLDRL